MSKIKLSENAIEDMIKKKGYVPQAEHIIFSFKHITNNQVYGLKYIEKADIRNANGIYRQLLERLSELSQTNIENVNRLGKIRGCEYLRYKSFSERVQDVLSNIPIIQKDSKLAVFRFGQSDCRLICKPDIKHTNLMHIVAFDFNYKAYDHG